MGEWVKRRAEKHECDKAYYKADIPDDANIGDQWKCACGLVYEIVGFDYGMQWDPYTHPVVKWKEVRREAPKIPTTRQEHGVYGGIYAPGTK